MVLLETTTSVQAVRHIEFLTERGCISQCWVKIVNRVSFVYVTPLQAACSVARDIYENTIDVALFTTVEATYLRLF